MPFSRCRYHIVWATKNRDPMIDPDMEPIIHKALFLKAQDMGGKIIVVGNIEDHIHIIAAIPPSVPLPDFIRTIKAGSSFAVHKAFPHKSLFAWQKGYGIFTLNPNDFQAAVEYVVNQKAHHAKNNLWNWFERWEE